MAVFRFLEMAAVVLDLVDAYLYHAETAFRSVYHCTKPDWRRCNSFDNVKVSIIIAFWLKKPIHAPKIYTLVDLTPQTGSVINAPLKGTSLGRSTSYEV